MSPKPENSHWRPLAPWLDLRSISSCPPTLTQGLTAELKFLFEETEGIPARVVEGRGAVAWLWLCLQQPVGVLPSSLPSFPCPSLLRSVLDCRCGRRVRLQAATGLPQHRGSSKPLPRGDPGELPSWGLSSPSLLRQVLVLFTQLCSGAGVW